MPQRVPDIRDEPVPRDVSLEDLADQEEQIKKNEGGFALYVWIGTTVAIQLWRGGPPALISLKTLLLAAGGFVVAPLLAVAIYYGVQRPATKVADLQRARPNRS